MGPGLPGFGIASIFYIAAAILAPLRVAWVAHRRPDITARWRTAWTQCALGCGMLVALIGFYALLDLLITRAGLPVSEGPVPLRVIPNWVYAVLTLGIVLLIGSVVGIVASLRHPDDVPADVAAGHAAGVAPMVLDLRAQGTKPRLQPPIEPADPDVAQPVVASGTTPRWHPRGTVVEPTDPLRPGGRVVRWWPAALLDEANQLVIDLRDDSGPTPSPA